MPTLILDENHRYTLDGRRLDGLTSTIKEAGLIRGGSERDMARGTAVHRCTEYWDKDTLDMDSVDPEFMPYLESWQTFRRDQGYTPILIEEQIWHPELMVGMTLDRAPGPLDLKSGRPEPWHALQLAVHWATLRAHGKADLAMSPAGIYLDPDGGPPKVRSYTQAEMREAFKVYASMLHFIRWRREKYGNAG